MYRPEDVLCDLDLDLSLVIAVFIMIWTPRKKKKKERRGTMAGLDRSIGDIMAFSIELNAGDDEDRSFDSERHGRHLPDSAIASVLDCYFGVNRGLEPQTCPSFKLFLFCGIQIIMKTAITVHTTLSYIRSTIIYDKTVRPLGSDSLVISQQTTWRRTNKNETK